MSVPFSRCASVAGLAIAAGAALALGLRPEGPVRAGTPPPSAEAVVAVAATPHDAEATSTGFRLVTFGGGRGARPTKLGAVAHPPGAVVRGVALCGARAVAVVAGEGARDWDAGLFVADETRGVRRLLGGVLRASRPLASRDGAIYVERGAEGLPPSVDDARRGRLRVDDLRVDAVDPATGVSRTLHGASGYALHLAGELGGELLVYRVDPEGAEIVAVDRASGATRAVATVPPFARDFTVDAGRGALVMSNRDDADAHLWSVERVDVATGARTRLLATRDDTPAPFALRDGALAVTAPGRGGLLVIAPGGVDRATVPGAVERAGSRVAPRGEGFDAVAAATGDGAWVALVHTADGAYDETLALYLPTRAAVPIGGADERVEPLGFVGTCGEVAR